MALPFLLLAAQASGMALNVYQTNKANSFAKLATRLDQQQLDLTMQQEQLASTQQSILNTQSLQETLATQRSIMAARGQMTGVGSAKAIEQGSLRAFESDEYARNLSMVFRQGQINREKKMMEIGRLGDKAVRFGKLAKSGTDLMEFNSMLGTQEKKPGSKGLK